MVQKFLYIVDHAIPFPSSEYGGLYTVIAENNDECFDLISNHYEYDGYSSSFGKLKENIINAHKFALLNEEPSAIIEFFTT